MKNLKFTTTIILLFLSLPISAARQDVLATINLIEEPIWQLIDSKNGESIASHEQLKFSHKNRNCLLLKEEFSSDKTFQLAMKLKDTTGIDPVPYEGLGLQFINTNSEKNTTHQLQLHASDDNQKEQTWQVTIRASEKWETVFLPFSEFKSVNGRSINKNQIFRISVSSNSQQKSPEICLSDLYFYTTVET